MAKANLELTPIMSLSILAILFIALTLIPMSIANTKANLSRASAEQIESSPEPEEEVEGLEVEIPDEVVFE